MDPLERMVIRESKPKTKLQSVSELIKVISAGKQDELLFPLRLVIEAPCTRANVKENLSTNMSLTVNGLFV